MHVIHVYSEERRADRNCMTIFARVRTLTQGRNWLGTERDEQVKGRRPRTSIHTHVHTHRASGQREGRREVGKEDTAEGFITRDLLLLPGGRGPLRNGQRRCIRRGVCLSDTCSSRTHTRIRTCVRGGTRMYGCRAHRWDEPTSVHPVS